MKYQIKYTAEEIDEFTNYHLDRIVDLLNRSDSNKISFDYAFNVDQMNEKYERFLDDIICRSIVTRRLKRRVDDGSVTSNFWSRDNALCLNVKFIRCN